MRTVPRLPFTVAMVLISLLACTQIEGTPTPSVIPTPTPVTVSTPVPAFTVTATPAPAAPAPTLTPPPATAPALSSTPVSTAPIACEVDTTNNRASWTSSGTSNSGYIALPEGAGPFPAVMVLHTSGGLNVHTKAATTALAGHGYVALAPDYFAPEGITRESYDVSVTLTEHVDRIREHLDRGIECLKSLSYVDAGRMATIGFSLGGYFALLLGARDDIDAAVGYYGAYHGGGVSRADTKYALADVAAAIKARVLMFHGDADSQVRIRVAQRAQQLLLAAGKESELVVYPGVEHRFDQVDTPVYDAQAAADAGLRTLAFLQNHLR
ncbi:MAG: dienelactone hydrolase family protein [Chloroflexi bacterium]|nr:dienelactone hydrolase family protein [Chloroflexota bacterium]